MNNIIITKAKEGKGYYLDVEGVIPNAPLTGLELFGIYMAIKANLEDIVKEAEEETNEQERRDDGR